MYPNLARLLGDVTRKKDCRCCVGKDSSLVYLLTLERTSSVLILVKNSLRLQRKENTTQKFQAHYFSSPSHDLYMIQDGAQDIAVCVLALQNIEKLQDTMKEVARVLTPHGRF